MVTKQSNRRRKSKNLATARGFAAATDTRAIIARRLDMLANFELQHGHHHTAEHLARRAAALREVAQ